MTDYPTARCEHTQLPLGECAESCCRPDLKAFRPIPEVWMRVTEPAGRPVIPAPSDVAAGNVHALLQVVSGRSARPDAVEMVREMCEASSHVVRIEKQPSHPVEKHATPAGNNRKSKGKRRRQKAGRSAGKAPQYHRTNEPPLLEQLWASAAQSGSTEAGVTRPASSRPTARLDAIDTAVRIDSQVDVWLNKLNSTPPVPRRTGTPATETEVRLNESVSRLRHLASLGPSIDYCGRVKPERDRKPKQVICCDAHRLEADITRWWTWARVVTGWDTPAWQPANTCPLCGIRGTLRVRLDEQRATCINDACRETWDSFTIGLLAAHIRTENNDTEEAS